MAILVMKGKAFLVNGSAGSEYGEAGLLGKKEITAEGIRVMICEKAAEI
jgi:hypothetical protein